MDDPRDTSEDDPTPRPVSRSSVLYALGGLTAQTQANKEAIEKLPDQLVAVLGPRLTNLEAFQVATGPRLDALEKERWLTRGGLAVILTAIGWVVVALKPIGIHLGPT